MIIRKGGRGIHAHAHPARNPEPAAELAGVKVGKGGKRAPVVNIDPDRLRAARVRSPPLPRFPGTSSTLVLILKVCHLPDFL